MENFKQLCVWPATLLEENQIQDFVNFFQEDLGVRVEYKTTLLTKPDLDDRGRVVPDTGGRHTAPRIRNPLVGGCDQVQR